jgi:hypothetical protein
VVADPVLAQFLAQSLQTPRSYAVALLPCEQRRASDDASRTSLNNRDWRITRSALWEYFDGQADEATEPPSETWEVNITAWREIRKA